MGEIRLITPEQRAVRRAAEEAEAAREDAERHLDGAERQRRANQRREAFVEDALQRIRISLEEGRAPCLHTVEYLQSDYVVEGRVGGLPPNPLALLGFGLDGWEVIASVPRTLSMPLVNISGGAASYGGGMGGNIHGVYLLMRLPITMELMERRPDFVRDALVRAHDLAQEPRKQARAIDMGQGTLPTPPPAPEQSRGSGGWYGFGVSMPMGGFDF